MLSSATSSDSSDTNTTDSDFDSTSDSEANSEKNPTYSEEEIDDEEELDFLDVPLFEGCKHSIKSAYILILLFVMKNFTLREGFSDLLLLIKDLLPTSVKFTISVEQDFKNQKSTIIVVTVSPTSNLERHVPARCALQVQQWSKSFMI